MTTENSFASFFSKILKTQTMKPLLFLLTIILFNSCHKQEKKIFTTKPLKDSLINISEKLDLAVIQPKSGNRKIQKNLEKFECHSTKLDRSKPKPMSNGFVREYSADSSEIYDSKYEDINGCRKVVEWKSYNKYLKLKSEWIKQFKVDSTQTCDFSAYTILKKKYKNEKLISIKEYSALSEASEEEPSGTWKYYDSNEKLIKTEKFNLKK